MRTTCREMLFIVLIGLSCLTAIRVGAQGGSEGGSGSAFNQPQSDVVERAQSLCGCAEVDLQRPGFTDLIISIPKTS